MQLTFVAKQISIDFDEIADFAKSQVYKNKLSSEEQSIVNFIHAYRSGQQQFEFRTSGSTGKPKVIELSKTQLSYSARQTINFLNLTSEQPFLLCINPAFIGGTMQIVRAIEAQTSLDVVPPAGSVNVTDRYALTTMVPMQIERIYTDKKRMLSQFDHILIGGAPLDPALEQKLSKDDQIDSNIYLSYGMTETASHIALRSVGVPTYTVLGDCQLSLDEDNCLGIQGSITQNKFVQTNDIVELVVSGQFKWLGRRDHVINSGGIKIHPEQIEAEIKARLDTNLLITGIEDQKLGTKAVLLIEGQLPDGFSFEFLPKYHRPKITLENVQFFYFENDKMDRLKTIREATHQYQNS